MHASLVTNADRRVVSAITRAMRARGEAQRFFSSRIAHVMAPKSLRQPVTIVSPKSVAMVSMFISPGWSST